MRVKERLNSDGTCNEENLYSVRREILNFIRHYIKENGYSPSIREINEAMGLKSTASVHSHLNKLEQYGLIKRGDSHSRTVRLSSDVVFSDDMIPINMKVSPIEKDIYRVLPLPAIILNSTGELFACRVGKNYQSLAITANDFIVYKDVESIEINSIYLLKKDNSFELYKCVGKALDKCYFEGENSNFESFSSEIFEDLIGVVTNLFRVF